MNPPAAFAPSPARDGRFEVKDRWSEMVNLPEGHPDAGREFLHRQLNEELNSLEMAARNLVDFPDADWNLRLAIARKPAGAGYHMALGLVLLQLGDRNAANAAFLEELRYHPDSQPARQQLALLEQALASAPSSPPR